MGCPGAAIFHRDGLDNKILRNIKSKIAFSGTSRVYPWRGQLFVYFGLVLPLLSEASAQSASQVTHTLTGSFLGVHPPMLSIDG